MMAVRIQRLTREELEAEKTHLLRQLATLEKLADREWEMRERLKQVEFLLGGEQ